MPINVNVDFKGLSTGRFNGGQRWALNAAATEMEQYVPLKEGHLRGQVATSYDCKTIIYTTLYAHRQFYAPKEWHFKEPGTGPRWDLKLKGNHAKMEHVKHAFIEGAKLDGSD